MPDAYGLVPLLPAVVLPGHPARPRPPRQPGFSATIMDGPLARALGLLADKRLGNRF